MLLKAMTDTGFSDRLRRARGLWQWREGRQLTQMELARLYRKASGESITQSSISDWLNGISEPTLLDILYLSRILGVDPGWLAFGDYSGAPRPTDPVRERAIPISERKKKN